MSEQPAIALRDLTFAYPPLIHNGDPVRVYQGLSLLVEPGARVALLGPTGGGKTTLAYILAALAPHMTGGTLQGVARVNGRDVAHTPPAQMSTDVGLVFQSPDQQLFNMTVADEIAFGLEGLALPPNEIERRLAAILADVGLQGLEERPPWQLSGGQQKRLAIAAVLAMRPPILVLDEPLGGLDPVGRRTVMALLERLRTRHGVTILLIEQHAEFVARWADRVLVVADGRLLLDGTPREVFAHVHLLETHGVPVPQMAALTARLRAHGLDVPLCLHVEEAAQALPAPRRVVAPPVPPARTAPPAVEIEHVSFAYEQETVPVPALQEVSCTIPQGQFVALVGANGSGKSTLARHLNGLLKPQQGRVRVMGHETHAHPVSFLARMVGYVFQNPDHQIFAPTVREEIAFGLHNLGVSASETARRVDDALQRFGLHAYADVPPAVLGYGLRRLVTVAAVWAMRPPIWVLDEPTTGLDAHYTAILADHMRRLHAEGHTILLITHDMALVGALAERVLVLHAGRLVADTTPRDLFIQHERLAEWGLEAPPLARLLAARRIPPPSPLTLDTVAALWANTP
ncbi:MAG: ATP-binding cassette domain-containing protein [Ardenticatenia bacterium]|nr:MAG: ATP-binding cassette domain-containing protein [Ardenticatenia bacterium]